MSRPFKAFLATMALIFIWGGPVLAIIGVAGVLTRDVDASRVAVGVGAALYFVVLGLLAGGVLKLLLSIDDRLERLEGKR